MILISGIRVVEQVYKGVDSAVYRGVGEADGRKVVVKVLARENPTPNVLALFLREY